mgnify:CR=1 FL=1
MDIKLEKKPWYIRYRYYLAGGILFLAFIIYVIILSAGPSKLRIDQENVQIAEVKNDKFMEYVDVEGLIQPILTIIVNARESGSVDRIVGEEGSLLQKGDTILVLENPDLIHNIEEQRDDLEKQLISFREKEIEMEQKSLTLQQQTLQTNYELARLQKSFNLDKEEYKMGIKSKAQLEVAEDEYNYNVKKAKLQRESLRQDSVVAIIRRIAEVSKLFIDSGIITIAAFISPNNDIREMAANIIGQEDFYEVYVSTPLTECERRDVKGLYAKARRGEIKNFTGISAPFEAPLHPALMLDTSKLSLEESVNQLLDLILPKIQIKK